MILKKFSLSSILFINLLNSNTKTCTMYMCTFKYVHSNRTEIRPHIFYKGHNYISHRLCSLQDSNALLHSGSRICPQMVAWMLLANQGEPARVHRGHDDGSLWASGAFFSVLLFKTALLLDLTSAKRVGELPCQCTPAGYFHSDHSVRYSQIEFKELL